MAELVFAELVLADRHCTAVVRGTADFVHCMAVVRSTADFVHCTAVDRDTADFVHYMAVVRGKAVPRRYMTVGRNTADSAVADRYSAELAFAPAEVHYAPHGECKLC